MDDQRAIQRDRDDHGRHGADTFSITTGSLPSGLTLNAATGAIGGTPSATGSFSFTVTATDTVSATASQAYTVTINPAVLVDTATFSGSAQVSSTAATQVILGDSFVPVSSGGAYQLSGTARSGNGSGGQYVPADPQYFGYACYDVDHNQITALDTAKVSGSTDTVLAQPLNPGETQIFLVNASGWYAGSVSYERSLAWYGYTNKEGYTYPDYTYTRNVLLRAWAAGGISGNVITLSQPWSGPALAAGAAVRNATSGGSFDYAPTLTDAAVPASWTTYTLTVSGTQQNGVDNPAEFRPGTVYIKPVMLVNYQGTAGNLVTWQNVTWTLSPSEVGDIVNDQVLATGGTGAKSFAVSSGTLPTGLS